MNVDIVELMKKQDEIEGRKKHLMESFIPFREGLLNCLENFVAEAINVGVKDVEPLDKSQSSKEVLKVSAGMNLMEFVLLSTNEVYYSDIENDELAAKIFIYGKNGEKPHIVITFQEAKENKNVYFAKWSTTEGLKWLIGTSVVVNPVASGEEAANKLIHHFYSFTNFWSDQPSFQNFNNERYSKKSIGFVK